MDDGKNLKIPKSREKKVSSLSVLCHAKCVNWEIYTNIFIKRKISGKMKWRKRCKFYMKERGGILN